MGLKKGDKFGESVAYRLIGLEVEDYTGPIHFDTFLDIFKNPLIKDIGNRLKRQEDYEKFIGFICCKMDCVGEGCKSYGEDFKKKVIDKIRSYNTWDLEKELQGITEEF